MADFGSFRTMVLSFTLGGSITPKQKQWILDWVKNNASSANNIEKAATIAYQYDAPDELVQKIRELKPTETY